MAKGFISALREPQNRSVGTKLLHYTLMMFTLPIIGFYLVESFLLRDTPYLWGIRRNNWATLFSVCVVNVIITSYVIMAFNEKDEGEEGEEGEKGEGKEGVPRVGIFAKKGKNGGKKTD
ncbi:hypothetical protein TrRE_jg8959 [Triparma retinervis]|uniref:Vacuolar ATPase assembly integral membrane protein VMA21 homolog n=1 Tax=Triparma retinervis TaxID=2557542 RepID=A0A9W7AFH8_9STRA|nr:hypothetical protein TrRE_jg8959 [Triparma retinervis]